MIEFTQNASAYQVTWGYRIKPVYRILNNEKYLNDLFENGSLFISCLKTSKSMRMKCKEILVKETLWLVDLQTKEMVIL